MRCGGELCPVVVGDEVPPAPRVPPPAATPEQVVASPLFTYPPPAAMRPLGPATPSCDHGGHAIKMGAVWVSIAVLEEDFVHLVGMRRRCWAMRSTATGADTDGGDSRRASLDGTSPSSPPRQTFGAVGPGSPVREGSGLRSPQNGANGSWLGSTIRTTATGTTLSTVPGGSMGASGSRPGPQAPSAPRVRPMPAKVAAAVAAARLWAGGGCSFEVAGHGGPRGDGPFLLEGSARLFAGISAAWPARWAGMEVISERDFPREGMAPSDPVALADFLAPAVGGLGNDAEGGKHASGMVFANMFPTGGAPDGGRHVPTSPLTTRSAVREVAPEPRRRGFGTTFHDHGTTVHYEHQGARLWLTLPRHASDPRLTVLTEEGSAGAPPRDAAEVLLKAQAAFGDAQGFVDAGGHVCGMHHATLALEPAVGFWVVQLLRVRDAPDPSPGELYSYSDGPVMGAASPTKAPAGAGSTIKMGFDAQTFATARAEPRAKA
eukprot:gene26846-62481_t